MTQYEVVGIGNAVVDVISHADDTFLNDNGIEKGIMQLIERDRAESLYATMQDRLQTPGGSVANTIAGIGALGLSTAFIGRVRDDDLGQFYAKAMTDIGIDFVNAPVTGGENPTSRCMIFVTPDGERSLNTYLGISTGLTSDDVPQAVASKAKLMFLEGYLFDHDAGKTAFREAARAATAGGGMAGIAISDPFCVERHRDDFLALIENDLGYVIGNEAELRALWETDDTEVALARTAEICPLVVCTRSGDGVTLMRGEERVDVPVEKVVPVDATGAGDQFAAGFLYGMATDRDLETCGKMGNICAAEVISHIGPRPQTSMMDLFKEQGLV
ncbi:MAG: adenosine kinase [Sulfitobacter litoralis]|jgi:sugar/nucleoside kinase (ribokinase family)|uniref:Sugar or nucleoside kinase, ribokinase family n=1 Tax=Sulfitobacter litoralis TaxID=335975 RepID=A0ABY0RJS4_9RHOB|nr:MULTISPECIES: adenosine kinase [Sulfitobacter]MBQ0716466.1 adenosine kinase [Sulfitobacter litoralis]MBQ0765231.1 adenosine kinase [Sulfitobacter litoralis]MBQ0802134.1 adenosine kinase [Sulfitobacter litoralis]MCF7727193.1 adenosine kinase [Sulfitobacter sp. M22]MCF7778556.1 adenosine kinase [Sulfitobacter sp. M220]|tara:strand:+ start:505 stop:1494 length:990 start_codon:yes stop_codon:yes gene_type:complete